MFSKVKFVLPILQMLLAIIFLLAGHQQLQTGRYNNFGPPAARLAYAINAPASVLRIGCFRFLDSAGIEDINILGALSNFMFILGVGLLWFFVIADNSSRHYDGTGISPNRRWLKIAFYLFAIVLGMVLALLGAGAWLGRHVFGMPMAEVITETILYCAWGLFLISIYGRDLIRFFSHEIVAQRL